MINSLTNVRNFGDISPYRAQFIASTLNLFMAFGGRANILNLSRKSAFCEKTFHRHFSQNFNFLAFNANLIPYIKEPILAVDASFVPKNGTKTERIGKFWNAKESKAVKGLEINSLCIINPDSKEAYHLIAYQTPASLSNGTRMDKYVQDTQLSKDFLPNNLQYVVADGFYAKFKMVIAVHEMGLFLISRLRSDANLRYIDESKRNKKGAKVDFKDLSQLTQNADKKYYYGVVYSVRFKCRIMLVSTKRNGKIINFFSTDVNITPEKLIKLYQSRFQIEFLFRDAKQFTGLTQSQTKKSEKIEFHVNMSLSAINRARLQYPPNERFSMASSKQYYINQSLLNFVESQLGDFAELFKNHPNYNDWLNFGVIHPI